MLAWFRKAIAACLILSMGAMAVPLPAYAGMLSTEAALSSPERDRVNAFVNRADVRAQLEARGISPADVNSRLAALSDDEVARIAGQIDTLPAGGDAVGAIIGAAVLIFIILLITDLLGYTHVFPFTKSMR